MSTATAGRSSEYAVRDHLIAAGWTFVMRAAGSRGPADLLMAHPLHGSALIQVGRSNKTLGPAARERFLTAAEMCGALPLLAVVVPYHGIRWWHVNRGLPRTWTEWSPE